MLKTKLSLASVMHLAEQTKRVLKRFPLTAVIAVIGTITALYLVDNNLDSQEFLIKILMTCCLGFPLLTALTIYGERSIKKLNHFGYYS